MHGDCLKKLERKLPRSCAHVFNNQTTKNTPNKVLDKNFGTHFYKRINKDILFSLCGCTCGQGFLVKGNRSKKKKTKKEAKVRPSSKTSASKTFGGKMKRKPRLKSIEKRCTSLSQAEVNINLELVILTLSSSLSASQFSPRGRVHPRSLNESSKPKKLKRRGEFPLL